jgi:MinD-like ATPase involved in chromosome partitioning or flagellar assembly
MRVAFQSARGAPGTTTLALATAVELSSRTSAAVVMVEADPCGGVLAGDLGLPATPSAVEFATDSRSSDADLFATEFVHAVTGSLRVLTSPCSARQTAAAWAAGANRFSDLARRLSSHMVLDLGRGVGAGVPPALDVLAERTVHVTRPTVSDLAALIAGLREHDSDPSMRLLLVAEQPAGAASVVHPREARDVLTPYGTVVEVPWDPAAAAQVRGAPARRKWVRSRLGSTVTALVDNLLGPTPPLTAESELTLVAVAP